MKNDYLLDSLDSVDMRLIEQATCQESIKAGEKSCMKKHRAAWLIPAAAAALALLMVGVSLIIKKNPASMPLPAVRPASINLLPPITAFDLNIVRSYQRDIAAEEGKEVELEYDYVPPENVEISWNPFFMHDGRLYWKRYRALPAEKYQGDLVLQVKTVYHRLPTEYKEGEGHFEGKLYEVAGYDPAFMLCTPNREYPDELDVYVCSNGYSVSYGKDVLEDRLFVSRDIKKVTYEDMDSSFHSWGIRRSFNAEDELVQSLIKVLDEAFWCVPYETEEQLNELFGYGVSPVWYLWLDLGGFSTRVWIYENGYAWIDAIGGYYLKYDEKAAAPIIKAMKAGEGMLEENHDTDRGLTLEQAREDETFGAYIPDYMPEDLEFDFCIAEYIVDHKTLEDKGVDQLFITFEAEPESSRYIHLTISDLEIVSRLEEGIENFEPDGNDSEPNVRHISFADVSEESLAGFRHEYGGKVYWDAVVYDGEVSVSVTAMNVTSEELVKVIESCFD